MNAQKYWAKKHEEYSTKDWITKPTIFAKLAVEYFPEKGKLLELGAGQGQDSRFFAKLGYEVVSTDLSKEALAISRKLSIQEDFDIEFQELDLSQGKLPYGDKSFDMVYASLSLHYFTMILRRNYLKKFIAF